MNIGRASLLAEREGPQETDGRGVLGGVRGLLLPCRADTAFGRLFSVGYALVRAVIRCVFRWTQVGDYRARHGELMLPRLKDTCRGLLSHRHIFAATFSERDARDIFVTQRSTCGLWRIESAPALRRPRHARPVHSGRHAESGAIPASTTAAGAA
eukprot:scaffold71379_cov60-Phaeocystis_antarctica.AAC.1